MHDFPYLHDENNQSYFIYILCENPLLPDKNRSRVSWTNLHILSPSINNRPGQKGNSSQSNWTHTTWQKQKLWGRPTSPPDQPKGAVRHPTLWHDAIPNTTDYSQYHISVFPLWRMFKIWALQLNPGPSINSRTWDTPLAHQPDTKADQTPWGMISNQYLSLELKKWMDKNKQKQNFKPHWHFEVMKWLPSPAFLFLSPLSSAQHAEQYHWQVPDSGSPSFASRSVHEQGLMLVRLTNHLCQKNKFINYSTPELNISLGYLTFDSVHKENKGIHLINWWLQLFIIAIVFIRVIVVVIWLESLCLRFN